MSDAIVKHQGGELFNVSMERFDGAFKLAHTLAASGMFPDAMTSLGISDFDMKDAKAAGVSMNAGSSWSKFPRNMLFARAVSNGFKWYCPNAIGGLRVYTPEEVGAPVNDDGDLDISKAKFADSVEIEKEQVGSPQGSLVLEGDRKKFDDVMTWAREDQIITEEVYEKSMEWKTSVASSSKLRKKTSEWEKKRERWNDVNCPQLIEALGGDDGFNTTTLLYISGDLSKDDYLSTFNSLKEAWDVDPEEENEDAPATLAVSTQEKIVETQMMIDEKDDDSVIGDELWSRLAALALVSGSQTIFQMQIRTAWHALDETISVQSVGDFSYASAPAATARKAFKFLVQKLSSK